MSDHTCTSTRDTLNDGITLPEGELSDDETPIPENMTKKRNNKPGKNVTKQGASVESSKTSGKPETQTADDESKRKNVAKQEAIGESSKISKEPKTQTADDEGKRKNVAKQEASGESSKKSKEPEIQTASDESKWCILFFLAVLVCILLCFTVYLYMEQNQLKIQLDSFKLESGSSKIDIRDFVKHADFAPVIQNSEINKIKIDKVQTDYESLDQRLMTVDSRVNVLNRQASSLEEFRNSAGDKLEKISAIEQDIDNLHNDLDTVKTFKYDIDKLDERTTEGHKIASDIQQRTDNLESSQEILNTEINRKLKPQIDKLINSGAEDKLQKVPAIEEHIQKLNIDMETVKTFKHDIEKLNEMNTESQILISDIQQRTDSLETGQEILYTEINRKIKPQIENLINMGAGEKLKKIPTIEDNIQNLHSDMENVKKFKHDIDTLDERSTEGQILTSEIQQRTDSLETGQEILNTEVNRKLKPQLENLINMGAGEKLKKIPAIEDNIQNLHSDMENVMTFKHDIDKLEERTTAGQKLVSAIRKRTNSLETGQESLNTDIERTLKPKIEKLIQQTGFLETELQTLKTEDVMALKNKKKEMENMLSSLRRSYEDTREKVDDVLLPNAFNKDSIMNALLLILVVCCIIWFYNRYTANKRVKPYGTRDYTPRSTEHHQPEKAIICRRVDLKNSICIVRFSDNMQPLDTKLLESILDGVPRNVSERCPRVFHNITSHEDIENLPLVKLFILFVNYSERHIIIEESGLGLGNFKRTTLQAINRIKGDAIIIYLKDPGSKTLPKNARYNPAIHCVKTQEALATLNRNGRFFSVFDSLTEFQKSCIQATISDVINDRST